MNTIHLILDTAEFKWFPPRYGQYFIALVNMTNTDKTFHLCIDRGITNELTYIKNRAIPAIYSYLGKTLTSKLQYIPFKINEPATFYFLDKNLNKMSSDTPTVHIKIVYN